CGHSRFRQSINSTRDHTRRPVPTTEPKQDRSSVLLSLSERQVQPLILNRQIGLKMPDESSEASLPCCFTCKKRFLLVVNGFFVILYVIYFITQVIVPLVNDQVWLDTLGYFCFLICENYLSGNQHGHRRHDPLLPGTLSPRSV